MKKVYYGDVVLIGTIECITGIHIGGRSDSVGIGGIDTEVIRNPLTNNPYIPGSSLKGKMRSLAEKLFSKEYYAGIGGKGDNRRHECQGKNLHQLIECRICRLFGASAKDAREHDNFPSKLIVRDCDLEDSFKRSGELFMTEAKGENAIDRITSKANPRTIERVPAGTKFKFAIIYKVEDILYKVEDITENYASIYKEFENGKYKGLIACCNEDLDLISKLFSYIEKDGIGGHVSRGYGQVKFATNKHYFEAVKVNEKEDVTKNEIKSQIDEIIKAHFKITDEKTAEKKSC